jgi:hypothetical protein
MPKSTDILDKSKDPKELIPTLCEFAASEHSTDQSTLLRYLDSKAFLLKLNEEKEYVTQRPKRLRVARVVKTLMDSPHPASKPTIVALARGRDFRSFPALEELLVRALAAVRPSPPEAIAYWDGHSQPESDLLHLVMEALFANRSDPALALFERKIADQRQEYECRRIWLREPMLMQRNDTAVLKCCERMVIQGTVPEPMRVLVVEALCDYHREWYLGCKKPRPPLRAVAPAESKQILRRICEFSMDKLSLTPEIKVAVETTLIEIGARKRDPNQGTV